MPNAICGDDAARKRWQSGGKGREGGRIREDEQTPFPIGDATCIGKARKCRAWDLAVYSTQKKPTNTAVQSLSARLHGVMAMLAVAQYDSSTAGAMTARGVQHS